MESQYSFLRVAIIISKILSYVAAALGVIGALVILFGKTAGAGKWASVGVLFSGIIYFLALYLLSDLIRLLLDLDQRITKIETNVQATKREIR
jgi:hypothetical protein